MMWEPARVSMACTRPRRLFRSPTTAPMYSSGTTTSTCMMGSSSTGPARRQASLNAMEPAILKAISEEATPWWPPPPRGRSAALAPPPAAAGGGGAVSLRLPADRLAVGHLRLPDVGLHLELPEQPVHDDLQVQLAHPRNQGLVCLRIHGHLEGRILEGQPGERQPHLRPG